MRILFFVFVVFTTSFAFGLRADLNGDGRVDMEDLSILASEWMQEDEGVVNNCLQFNAHQIVVYHQPALAFSTGLISVSVWMKPTTEHVADIIYKNEHMALQIVGKSIYSQFASSAGNVWIHVSEEALIAGQWNHICIVKSAVGVNHYVNGVPLSLTPQQMSGNPTLQNIDPLEIGLSFVGLMDDLRLYEKALSESEVAAIYNRGAGTKYTAAAAEGGEAAAAWNIDEGEGATITDAANGLTGMLPESISWITGGVPFAGKKPQSHARRLLLK